MAEWLQADGQRAPLDGDLVLERRRVQFLQMLADLTAESPQ